MRLLSLNLENFRNIKASRLTFSKQKVFFIGPNGQGKTNLLEAIGISSCLRSFRKSGMDGLVRYGEKQSRLFFKFLDDEGSEHETLFQFQDKRGKELIVDGEKIKRFSDYLGEFPSVAFSSRDFRLIRDGPSERRKWLDLVLSISSPEYFDCLKLYHRALRERNSLLKKDGGDKELDAFEKSLISNAFQVFQFRLNYLPLISSSLANCYQVLSGGLEDATLSYRPDFHPESKEELAERFLTERIKDRKFGTTRRGPHRDDFEFLLDKKDARIFSSEGQQKGLILGLRFAEFENLSTALNKTPLLLIDDVLGELDEKRRMNFQNLMPSNAQVFATGTSYPDNWNKNEWEIFEVKSGSFMKVL